MYKCADMKLAHLPNTHTYNIASTVAITAVAAAPVKSERNEAALSFAIAICYATARPSARANYQIIYSLHAHACLVYYANSSYINKIICLLVLLAPVVFRYFFSRVRFLFYYYWSGFDVVDVVPCAVSFVVFVDVTCSRPMILHAWCTTIRW